MIAKKAETPSPDGNQGPRSVQQLAGQEGFEPPTRGFGDRCSTVGATGLNFPFLMIRVLPAPRAELAQLQFILALSLVLRRGVVPFLAHLALERDDAAVTLRHDVNP